MVRDGKLGRYPAIGRSACAAFIIVSMALLASCNSATNGSTDGAQLDVMDKVVVDDWREAQSGRFGALRRHVDSGALSERTLHAELGQVVAGLRPGRESPAERILLWHRGLAILDIALGQLILERAQRADAGTMLRYR